MLTFLHPALLFGTLLFLVPLLIHLLNRQRYRRREWAAMEFLLNAYKKQRRRVRTENILLLILRCLLPILLALAIARPTLREVAGLEALGGGAHHVLVIDGSYSMGAQPEGAQSAFERARFLASELLERIEGRSGQKVSVVVQGVRPSWRVQDDLAVARARGIVAALPAPYDSARDLTESLVQVAELVEKAEDPAYRVYVFTDLQPRALGLDRTGKEDPAAAGAAGQDAFADTARDALERIAKAADLTLLDTSPAGDDAGTERIGNLQITGLDLGTPVAVVRVPVPVVATVRNLSDQPRRTTVTLELEGGEPVRKEVELDPGAETRVEFAVTFREVGARRLRAHLDADALQADNERFLVAQARERIRVLLVEGSSETEPRLQDSGHLRDVLDPTKGQGSAGVTLFAPRTIDTIAFLAGREALTEVDVIVLANVERVNEPVAAQIRAAMEAGVGLFVMLGERVQPESYNLTLHALGQGPMPMLLGQAAGFRPGGDNFYGCTIETPRHPVFADLDPEVYREIFQQTPIYRFFAAELPAAVRSPQAAQPDETRRLRDVQVLARVRDPGLSPLLVAARYGNAKALFLTSAVSQRPDRWNRLDEPWIAFPFLHPALLWLTVPAIDPFQAQVGSILTTGLATRPGNVAVVLPERAGGGKVPVAEESRALPGGRFALPPFRRTDHAGFYVFDLLEERAGESRARTLPFAVNVDPADGDLVHLPHSLVKERLGVARVLRALPSEGPAQLAAGASDLGPVLLLALLLFLVSEAVLARHVSVRRAG